MGVEYRLMLMDEFDWNYEGSDREDAANWVIASYPDFKIESSIPYMITIDIGRRGTEDVLSKFKSRDLIAWDAAYYQRDNHMELIKI